MLQWGWDWKDSFTDEQLEKNAKRISKIANVTLDTKTDKLAVAKESSIILPSYFNW